jgi:CubicO group peptidase (beta-lactamase class C family)
MLLDSVIGAGTAPGAVLGVSLAGRHYFYGAGRLGLADPTRPDSATVYDLASLTKVVSLTTLVMLAVDEKKIELDLPVAREVPAFAAGPDSTVRGTVIIRHLLTHSSGLPAWRPLYQEAASRTAALALVDTTDLTNPPGTRYVYSDLGAIVLTQAVEHVMGARIDTLFDSLIARPLGLRDTRYLPPEAWRPRIAPTENDPWRGRVLRGEVHDENAARLDGVSGHAGLFSSARDLVRFADWLLEEENGEPPTVSGGASRPFRSPFPIHLLSVREFTHRQDLPPGSSRALGWDTPSEGGSGGRRLSPLSFGHTGFTGTSIWIDPARRLAIVLLSNRVHPTRENPRFGPVRALLADRVLQALVSERTTR